MKALSINCLLLFFFNISFGQSAGGAEQDLLNIESKRLEAIVSRNHDFLNNLYDDEFHGVIASGQSLNKAKIIEFLETSNPHVIQSIEDLKTKVYDIVGVTTGKLVSKSKSGSIIGQSRFTHIYLRKSNQWKLIESQGTVIIQE